jgi:hypothetical protein
VFALPTAVHALVVAHDTATSGLAAEPAGAGVERTCHELPFQRSEKASPFVPPEPTARHSEVAGQETPSRRVFVTPEGLGWSDQLLPFQRSTRGVNPALVM